MLVLLFIAELIFNFDTITFYWILCLFTLGSDSCQLYVIVAYVRVSLHHWTEMAFRCVAFNCSNVPNNEVSLHKWPADKLQADAWRRFVSNKRKDWKSCGSPLVTAEDYCYGLEQSLQ